MSDSWMMGLTAFADLDLKTIEGAPGLGFYRLIAQIDVVTHDRQPEEEIVTTNITGEMWVHGANSREHYLGCLRRQGMESPIVTYPRTSKDQLRLELELEGGRIEAVERIRLGGDLFIGLDVHGMAYSAGERPRPVEATLHYKANQATWLEVLEQMGYRKTMLLEIPIPGDEAGPELSEAAKYLREAQEQLLHGKWRQAVAACRDVLESLSIALGDNKWKPPADLKRMLEVTKGMGKEERIRLMRWAMMPLTHAAKHADEVTARIEWNMVDARAVIIMTASVLQMAVEGGKVT